MPDTTEEITPAEYKNKFLGKEEKALSQALDIRKFEIELYWKRATYFWTFIGATMAGFLAIQASDIANKKDLSVILACLGFVFSFAWFCVNRGSKFWQENWEKHVDILENEVTGPLYKVILSRNNELKFKDKIINQITGPANISVSKVNQLISLYVFALWVFLLFYSLPVFSLTNPINWFYVLIIGLSVIVCISFLTLGKSYGGGYYHIAELRKSRAKPANNSIQSTAKAAAD